MASEPRLLLIVEYESDEHVRASVDQALEILRALAPITQNVTVRFQKAG